MGVDHPAGVIKNIVPIVMAGVLGIYGLIVAVIITQAVTPPLESNSYSTFNGYTHVSEKKLKISLKRQNLWAFLLNTVSLELTVCCRFVLWTFLPGCWWNDWCSRGRWCPRFRIEA